MTTPPVPTPLQPGYFDYPKAATQANLTSQQLALLIQLFERDYPYDLMQRELHILRACNAIARGSVTFEALIRADGKAA